MLIIVHACLIMANKFLHSKPIIGTILFQLSFASEVFLMDLVLLSLEKDF